MTEIRFAHVTRDNVTLKWAPALDDVGVVGYRVWMNGFAVATTSRLQATVDWFNDDMSDHVFQVRAMDAAGNQSQPSDSVLLKRPSPGPTSSPTPTPEPSTAPTPSESATAEPTQPISTATSDPSSASSPSAESSRSSTQPAGDG